jgi:hypothetical protein
VEHRGELWATALALLDVLEGHAERITIEPPGDRGNAIEFELVRAGVCEYHAVRCWKREVHWSESTSLSEICSAGIPHLIRDKLAAGVDQFHLVEQPWCKALAAWVEAAAGAVGKAGFWRSLHARFAESTSKCNRGKLMLALGCRSKAACFAMLKRLCVDELWPDFLRMQATARAALLSSDDEGLLAELLACALEAPGRALSSADLAEHLRRQGIPRRAHGTDAELAAAIEAANQRFLTSYRRAFLNDPAPADRRVEEIANLLQESAIPAPRASIRPQRHQWVAVTGRPGTGKSSLIVRLVEELASRKIPCLALRLDCMGPVLDTRAAGRQMGLPYSPVATLAQVTQGRDCVLVLEEIDSARRVMNSSPLKRGWANLLSRAADMFANMRVLAVDDGSFLATILWNGRTHVVDELPEDEVRRAVAATGFEAKALTERQMIVLRNPLHLSLLAVTAAGPGRPPLPFRNATELFDAFWEKKQQECAHLGLSPERCQRTVDRLCEEIDHVGTLFVPEAALADCGADAKILARTGVLLCLDGKWSFFHEAFYDFANARRHVDYAPLTEYDISMLPPGLCTRYVRQTMRLQRDRDFERYCRDLEALLNSPEAPDPAKKAVVDFLMELEDPTANEWNVVMHFMDSTNSRITHEALKIFVSNDQWFDLATESGAVDRWNAKWASNIDSWYSFLISGYYNRKRFPGSTPQKAKL